MTNTNTAAQDQYTNKAAEWCAEFLKREGAAERFVSDMADNPDAGLEVALALLEDYRRTMRTMSIQALACPAKMKALQAVVLSDLQGRA